MIQFLLNHSCNHTIHDHYPLLICASNGHLSCVHYLVGIGADVTYENNVSLQNAARHGHLSILQLLLTHGENIIQGIHLHQYTYPLHITQWILGYRNALHEHAILQSDFLSGEWKRL